MTREIPETHSLLRLFQALTETTFLDELGIGDPRLVDYVAGLLARFVSTQAIWGLRDADGRQIKCVATMISEAERTADEERRREYHRHVGDYTLFWTGVYPEALRKLKSSDSPDHLIDFPEQGKRSYYLASTTSSEEAGVYRRLSAEFDLCVVGLSQVRREWERQDPGFPTGRLIVA